MEGNRFETDRLHKVLDWRKVFPEEKLKTGQDIFKVSKIREINSWYYGNTFEIKWGRNVVNVRIYRTPNDLEDTWEDAGFECTACKRGYYSSNTGKCEHAAAAMMFWEKQHGPWVVWESDRNYRSRKEKEALQAERDRREQLRKRYGQNPIPAMEAFKHRAPKNAVIFDMPKLLAPYVTTQAAIVMIGEAKTYIGSYQVIYEVKTTREGEKWITFEQPFEGKLEAVVVWGQISNGKLTIKHALREKTGRYSVSLHSDTAENQRTDITQPLDEYDLYTISKVWDLADKESDKRITDEGAELFFKRIQTMREENARREIRPAETKEPKKPVIELLPRIVLEDGTPMLSFKVGVGNGKKYIVKDCYNLISAAQGEKEFILGKKETLHFDTQEFTKQSNVLFDFIQRNRVDSFNGTYQVSLKGSRLDNFYDMYSGGECELLDKTNNIKDELVKVGHMDIRFTLTADRLADARDNFLGVVVSGFVPVLIKGNSYKYVINTTGLSRISQQEQQVLEPFIAVADKAGYFRFQVGTDRLQEFYYRVLPGLLENPFVEFVDNCVDEASNYLPPEPTFTFYLDLDDKNRLSIRGVVAYDELEYTLVPKTSSEAKSGYHDDEQEERVLKCIMNWVPSYLAATKTFEKQLSDDEMYDFLTVGLQELEYYGRIKGTGGFLARRVISRPAVTVGVSVDTEGLLNISVTSKELSTKELMDVYNSYIQKKRYYRLKSGDFIDLTQDEELGELRVFLDEMEMMPKDVINKKIQIPMYRALYLNKMLEEHEKIASTRDRTYRAVIRNFKTVRDAEYEVPGNLEEIMRPYQVFGYKWLRTIQASGFGGILADEMGLGKTLQMIAVFKADKDAAGGKKGRGKKAEGPAPKPSLVVCPASLIYNWQEEIEKFAPDLSVMVMAGTQGVRKRALLETSDVDVYITSYDLLKRDIVLYETMQFANCVLDEAQYIKNSKAAAAKSVKLIHAEHRFALTGTPIENRLSELWSIFDFLMPGFLYTQTKFERDFEIPIAKIKDEDATEKLKAMTGPFILRRRKMDVLKDLPAKLEEVRYARLSGEQQTVYDAQVVRMKEMLAGGELAGEEKIKIFAELMRIRQICCDPSLLFENYTGESAKREACLELVKNAIEGGHRMLIFSQFVSMLNLLEEDLTREGIETYKIIGSTPKEKRMSLVRSFNENNVPVFLISLKAGGTGLNLTGADVVIHYDPWWNLAAQNQATDRAHRIGQTRQVTVFKLILKGTIEERIMALQDAKKDLAEAILEGSSESLMSLSAEELMALLG